MSSVRDVALDDVRARHQAVVDLIYFTDQQATTLLQLYVTVGLALATAAATALSGATPIPVAAGWGLLASVGALGLGCYFCLKATEARALNLPGRGAEFWIWASREDVSEEEAFSAYLKNLEAKQLSNNAVNAVTAGALKRAKRAGALTPAVFVVFSFAAFVVISAVSASGPGSSDCPNLLGEGAEEASAALPC